MTGERRNPIATITAGVNPIPPKKGIDCNRFALREVVFDPNQSRQIGLAREDGDWVQNGECPSSAKENENYCRE